MAFASCPWARAAPSCLPLYVADGEGLLGDVLLQLRHPALGVGVGVGTTGRPLRITVCMRRSSPWLAEYSRRSWLSWDCAFFGWTVGQNSPTIVRRVPRSISRYVTSSTISYEWSAFPGERG